MNNILENKQLLQVLELLENTIDDAAEEKLQKEWEDFISDRCTELFRPARTARPDIKAFPARAINDTLPDTAEGYAVMLESVYNSCLSELKAGSGRKMNIRSNYGVGILPSAFGCPLFVMPRGQNSLPNVSPLGGGAVPALLENGVPKLTGGLGGRVFNLGEMMLEIAARYPKTGRYVNVYHPDLQGPMDVAELIWGSELFYALYDDEDTVHALLSLICDTYERFMDKWNKMFPPQGYAFHWGLMFKGTIMLRDDSAMNLSSEMFGEYIKPYDARLLKKFGGGAVHFCGRGDHYIKQLCEMDGLNAVNLSQPGYNDMEEIYRNTVDKGIKLIGLAPETAEADRDRVKGQACV